MPTKFAHNKGRWASDQVCSYKNINETNNQKHNNTNPNISHMDDEEEKLYICEYFHQWKVKLD